MKDKIYKYGFLSVCGAIVIITLYFAAYGAIDRARAFAVYMYGGSHDDALLMQKCAIIEAVRNSNAMKGLSDDKI